MRIFIISILIIGAFIPLRAQKADSLAVKEKDWQLRGFRAGVDVISMIRTAAIPGLAVADFKVEADFKKYIPVFEFGHYSHTIDSLPRYQYHINGQYIRFGIESNFIHKGPDASVFSMGLRYGRAWQKDELQYSIDDPVWGYTSGYSLENKGIRAGWMELTGGLQVQISKYLWMGYSARFKFGLNKSRDEFVPFEIAGYGRSETPTVNNTTWGFQYFLIFGINQKSDSGK